MSSDDRLFDDGEVAGLETPEDLARALLRQMSRGRGSAASEELVRSVVEELDLREDRSPSRAPKMQLQWLRFTGVKELPGESTAIDYRQPFYPGVNVLLVEDNLVGKSSVQKAIRLGLTGDDSDLPPDVRGWIANVWLHFTLDAEPFTVALSRRNRNWHAVVVPGHHEAELDMLVARHNWIVRAAEPNEVQPALQAFFFERLCLFPLAWTDDKTEAGVVRERQTSWLTYFQALSIPDDGHGYLLCDPAHATGGQDGLIASSFLGLHLSAPLNRLMVRQKTAEKQATFSAEQVAAASADRERLQGELQETEAGIARVQREQRRRRDLVAGGEVSTRLGQAHAQLVDLNAEAIALEEEKERLNRLRGEARAQAKRADEALDLRLHLTGIEVRVCPNCDSAVQPEDLALEREQHACRLCHRPASDADTDDLARLRDLRSSAEDSVRRFESEHAAIRARLAAVERGRGRVMEELRELAELGSNSLGLALPTADELEQLAGLFRIRGRVEAALEDAVRRLESVQSGESDVGLVRLVAARAHKLLQKEAMRRNEGILQALGHRSQALTRRIGVASISETTCTSLGRVQLKKNGKNVPFSGLKNQGEQMRVKLSFFIAMMLLGREPGLGRHPGLLLIDQPGSHEMIPAHRRELARLLRETDAAHAEDLQILCFTAEPEFREAAGDARKVFSTQAGKWVF